MNVAALLRIPGQVVGALCEALVDADDRRQARMLERMYGEQLAEREASDEVWAPGALFAPEDEPVSPGYLSWGIDGATSQLPPEDGTPCSIGRAVSIGPKTVPCKKCDCRGSIGPYVCTACGGRGSVTYPPSKCWQCATELGEICITSSVIGGHYCSLRCQKIAEVRHVMAQPPASAVTPDAAGDIPPGEVDAGPPPAPSPGGKPNFDAIASSGGVTQLYRVIDLVNSGASPERVKQWCERQIQMRVGDR